MYPTHHNCHEENDDESVERSYFGTFTHIELHTTSWRILKVTMISHDHIPTDHQDLLIHLLGSLFKQDLLLYSVGLAWLF